MENKRISMNEKLKNLLDFMKQYPKIDIRFGYERQDENVLKEYSISREEFEEIQKYYKYIRQNKEKLTEEEIVGLQEACIDPRVFGYSSEIEELSETLKEDDFELFRHVEMDLFFAIKRYGSIENLKKLYMSGKIDIEDYSGSRLASKLIGLDNPELAKEVAINHNYHVLATRLGIKVDDIKKLMAQLTPKEQEVISYRNGLESGKRITIEETGRKFSVTRERIRLIETKAYKKLKHYSDRMSKESELSDLQEEDKKCDEALELIEQLENENKEQEAQTQADE